MSKRLLDDLPEQHPIGVKRPKGAKSTFERMKMRTQGMDAYSRHKMFMNNYYLYYKGSSNKFVRDSSNDKNDYDIIKEQHRFLWDEKSSLEAEKNWDARLAKRYYDKLFKEYCIADLSKYQENRFAMRWRVEEEVKNGKGQFICGSKKCNEEENLSSWEVNFAYVEHHEKKNALVKLRLCPDCSAKLNYHSKKRLIKKEKLKKEYKEGEEHHKKKKKQKRKHKSRSRSQSPSDSAPEPETSHIKEEPPSVKKVRTQDDSNAKPEVSASEIWSRPAPSLEVEKTKEDEFDEFFDDLLL
uniref:Protein FRA10AC1 n=1 Tax=Acrobeloides nanus TaxID=290746 RepID=A0A914E6I7_9BILA